MSENQGLSKKIIGCCWYLLIGLVLISGCSSIHINSGVKGRVVDEQTGVGIPEALVVRVWIKDYFGVGSDVITVKEVQTDKEGFFEFGWKFLFSPAMLPFSVISEDKIYSVKEGYRSNYILKTTYAKANLAILELDKEDCFYDLEIRGYMSDLEKNLPLLQAEYIKRATYYEKICPNETKHLKKSNGHFVQQSTGAIKPLSPETNEQIRKCRDIQQQAIQKGMAPIPCGGAEFGSHNFPDKSE